MAPEQLIGGEVDARTDLYATGVVLYECLTGVVPFDDSSPGAILARIGQRSAAPIRDFDPNVPAALSAAVERLMERDPARRFASARELADQLALVG